MRLIINQIVSEEDKEAIQKGVFGDVVDCMESFLILKSLEKHLMSIRMRFQMLVVSDFSK